MHRDSDRIKMKQSLLADIELDVQELKCLIDALSKDYNQALCEVTKRNISQMRSRLDSLYEELSTLPEHTSIAPQTQREEDFSVQLTSTIEPALFVPDILKTDLRSSISLNDSFRFTRELFNDESEKMNSLIKAIDGMTSFDEAMSFVNSEITLDEANDAALDFIELLKKRFT